MKRGCSLLVSVALVAGLAMAGCGSADERDSALSTSQEKAESKKPPPVPTPKEDKNTNERNTPLQRLCWARQELRRALTEGLVAEQGSEDQKVKYDKYSKLVSDLVRTVQKDTEGVPAAVADFRGAFLNGLQQAEGALAKSKREEAPEAFRATGNFFVFDDYPGSQAYVDAATAPGECAQP